MYLQHSGILSLGPPYPQASYHSIGRGGGFNHAYMFEPPFFYAGLRDYPKGLLLGFPWAIPPLGNPNLEGNLKEKLACITPPQDMQLLRNPHKSTPFFSSDQAAQITKDRSHGAVASWLKADH